LLFDDLHWIDPSSRELLDRVIEWVAGWPVLLLAMFRPEFQLPLTLTYRTTQHVTSVQAAIRVFCSFKQRRGWPGQARPRHKGNGQPLWRLV
jgi:hypothetical protein